VNATSSLPAPSCNGFGFDIGKAVDATLHLRFDIWLADCTVTGSVTGKFAGMIWA